jgi:hypothetical protein
MTTTENVKYFQIFVNIWHSIGNLLMNIYTGRFIMFSVIINIYKKKTKGPTLMELFTATGKLKKIF